MKCPGATSESVDVASLPVVLPKLLKGMPNVAELLGAPAWEGGEDKGQRIVMMFLEPTSCRILVKVEKQKLKFSAVGRNFDDAWAAAEMLLATGQVVWEQDQQGPSMRKKK